MEEKGDVRRHPLPEQRHWDITVLTFHGTDATDQRLPFLGKEQRAAGYDILLLPHHVSYE